MLGIESSCDETAVGIVKNGKELLSNAVASSMDLHVQYGGVVPEVAARSHIEVIIPIVEQSLGQAGLTWEDIDAIAVTYGAGLLGSLLIGVLTARTLAIVKNKPLYGVNHVEAHIYANFLTQTSLPGYALPERQPEFPMLGVIVSGNHTQLAVWQDHFDYKLLGQARDDAVGEAFDKVARMIGLPYPGGPNISRIAENGNADAYRLPKAHMAGTYDFSFSGLKTAVLRLAQEIVGKDYTLPSSALPGLLNDAQKANIAASFQHTACETIVDKAALACQQFQPKSVVVGGGVAANGELRRQLAARLPRILTTQHDDIPLVRYTDLKLCGDNGAMVATLGCFMAMHNQPTVDPYSLEAVPQLSM